MTTDQDIFARPSIFAGARAPERLVAIVTPGERVVDLTTVTAVRFRVRGATIGDDQVWTTTIVQQRGDRIRVEHIFDADGAETRNPGRYRIIPELILPDGVLRAEAFYLGVKP
jgi:hypothetical protein